MQDKLVLTGKDKLILMQNLLNRAVEMGIAKYGADVDVDKVDELLTELSKLAGKKIKNM